jgi:hypothetical protein
MFLVGLGAVLIGGCPFRQLVLAGEGYADAGAAVLGMLVAGGLVQTWGLRSTIAGATPAGQLATLIGLVLVIGMALAYRERPDGPAATGPRSRRAVRNSLSRVLPFLRPGQVRHGGRPAARRSSGTKSPSGSVAVDAGSGS